MVQRIEATCQSDFPVMSEAKALSLDSSEEALILSEIGSFSACDVWMHVTPDWLERVILRVYARVGRARVLMRSVQLSSVPATEDGDFRAGIAVSLRGFPCRAFEVTVQPDSSAPLEDGSFHLQAWHAGGSVSASAGDGHAPRAEVVAQLQGREAYSGDLKDVRVDEDGKLLIENPILADDYIRLPEVGTVPSDASGEIRLHYKDHALVATDRSGLLRAEFEDSDGVFIRSVGAPIVVQPQDSSSGVGSAAIFAGGKGASGQAGGTTFIGADNGGTPGSDHAGNIILQLGTPAGDISAGLRLRTGSTDTFQVYVDGDLLNQETSAGYGLGIWADQRLYLSCSGFIQLGSNYNYTRVSSGPSHPVSIRAGTVLQLEDSGGTARVVLTPATGPTVEATPTSTSFTVGHQKRSGTGANAGSVLRVAAQDGQNVSSGTNNSGGELRLAGGAKGSGGANGMDGAVRIQTGTSDRIFVAGNGSEIAFDTSNVNVTGDTSGLISEVFADVPVGGFTGASMRLPRRYRTNSGGSDLLYEDTAVPTNSAILYRFTVIGRAVGGTDAGKCAFGTRQALVSRATGVPVRDTAYDTESEQRMFPNGATPAGFRLEIGVNSGNSRVELNLSYTVATPTASTWHWLIWGERIVLTP